MVSKRISARFFQPVGASGKVQNPPSGTVVDDVVTLPERYDFFLISQVSKENLDDIKTYIRAISY